MRCTLENEDGSHKDLLISIKVNKPTEFISIDFLNLGKESFAKSKPTKSRETREIEKKTQDELKKQRKKSIIPEQQIPEQSINLYQILLNAAQKVFSTQDPPHQITQEM